VTVGKIVLVHGAFHGAWCWDDVVAELTERGLDCDAVELPLTSFSDDITSARSAIAAAGDGAVVCGHSYGGCVISAAADQPGVRRLVYLCALQVDAGEDPNTIMSAMPTALREAVQVDKIAGTYSIDPARQHMLFYGDTDPSEAAALSARLRPMPVSDSWVWWRPPAWRRVPSTYVVCTKDNALHPDAQRQMAKHATEQIEWESDHSPFLTRPGVVADLLARYAAG
jgi:pimeloyl-ACP methyl ester carboxylesterase